MNKIKHAALVIIAASVALATSDRSEDALMARRDLSDEEAILIKAFAIRMRVIETNTGFRFDAGFVPRVVLKEIVGLPPYIHNEAEYDPLTETIYVQIAGIRSIEFSYNKKLGEIGLSQLAMECGMFLTMADHELGHELTDQVSRRTGKRLSWYSLKRYDRLNGDESYGMWFLSEGMATYFQYSHCQAAVEAALTPTSFPRHKNEVGDRLNSIKYSGGHWLVNDVLKKFGERGMIWLLDHPFRAGHDLRADAVRYHDRALKELSR